MKHGLKMYLVKKEVMAHNMKEALTKDGNVYSVELADEKYQPEDKVQPGFINKKNKKTK